MEGRLLARARETLAAQREKNQRESERRREEAFGRIPELGKIEAQLRVHLGELISLALGHSERSAQEIEAACLALRKRRGELLSRAGYPEDWLDEILSCPRCRDTGTLPDGRHCDCLLALYKGEQTRELSPLLGEREPCFDSFRLSLYDAQPLREGEPAPRRQMERVYGLCRRYAESFGPQSGNMLFSGPPGLGKTFLAASIARVVAEQGRSVAYDSVSALLSAFEREKFSREEDEQSRAAERCRQLMDCDLLILDDLGTEMATAFSLSALYTLLDGRLRGNKKTIITTNLDRDGLRERYGAQLASRLLGEYVWLEFLGRDIRAMKKEML